MKDTPAVGSGDERQNVEADLRDEVESLAEILIRHESTIASLRHEVDLYNRSLGWRLQQRLSPFGRSMLAIPVLRQIYRTLYRAMEIWVDEGFLKIFARTADKLHLALRGRNFLVAGHDRRPLPLEDQYEQWIRRHGESPSRDSISEFVRFSA